MKKNDKATSKLLYLSPFGCKKFLATIRTAQAPEAGRQLVLGPLRLRGDALRRGEALLRPRREGRAPAKPREQPRVRDRRVLDAVARGPAPRGRGGRSAEEEAQGWPPPHLGGGRRLGLPGRPGEPLSHLPGRVAVQLPRVHLGAEHA